MNILFVCSRNKLRSPTAEQVFSTRADLEVASAGLNHDAEVTCTAELVARADIVFVMEKAQPGKLSSRFGRHLKNSRVVCLDIADRCDFMDPELVALLQRKVAPPSRAPSP